MTSMFTKTAIVALIAGSLGTAAAAESVGVSASGGASAGVSADTGSTVSDTMDTAESTVDSTKSTVDSTKKAVTSTAQAAQDTATGMAAGTSADAKVNYGTVISGLKTGATAGAAADIQALGTDISVDTVLLSEIDGASQAKALDKAVNAQADAMASFYSAVDGNAELKAALEAEGFEAKDVVGFESHGEGRVTLVIDDRA